ncbi:HDOD domain-containing protein [Magnetococcales bacterium HHB-1]
MEELAQFGKIGIPSQPKVVMDVINEMQSKDPDVNVISNLVERDPHLSARVLKLVNSPYFGSKMPIMSVSHGIAMLGMKDFQRLVVVGALRETLGGKNDSEMDVIWHYMTVSAKVAEYMASWLKTLSSPEEAYMAALFHDCAIPLMRKKFPDYLDLYRMHANRSIDIIQYEEEAYDTNHALVGSLLARSWGMPEDLSLAIRYHHVHNLSDVSGLGDSSLWFLLRFTDYVMSHISRITELQLLDLARSYNFKETGLDEKILRDYGLSRARMKDLFYDVRTVLVPSFLDGDEMEGV